MAPREGQREEIAMWAVGTFEALYNALAHSAFSQISRQREVTNVVYCFFAVTLRNKATISFAFNARPEPRLISEFMQSSSRRGPGLTDRWFCGPPVNGEKSVAPSCSCPSTTCRRCDLLNLQCRLRVCCDSEPRVFAVFTLDADNACVYANKRLSDHDQPPARESDSIFQSCGNGRVCRKTGPLSAQTATMRL